MLEAAKPSSIGGDHVPLEVEAAIRAQAPPHLDLRTDHVVDRAKDQREKDRIEGSVGEGKPLRIPVDPLSRTDSSSAALARYDREFPVSDCRRYHLPMLRTPPALGAPPAHPKSFLEVRVRQLDELPGLLALCAGYEKGSWRCNQLARHMLEWLPEFVLRDSEREGLAADNAVKLLAKAAETVYVSDKYEKRGELGELLLHVILRQEFRTTPAIAKLFFKDSPNDTVKGFDAVHVVATGKGLELWLGEAKLYEDIHSAINAVVKDLHDHSEADYLRREFAAITNKIDPAWPHSDRLMELLDRNTSLDSIFECMCVPVLLTYNSTAIESHGSITEEFKKAFEAEVLAHHESFKTKNLPENIRIHLLLVPLGSKKDLVERFDENLKALQSLA